MIDRAIEVALSGEPSPNIGFLVSTAFTAVSDEVTEIWKRFPGDVEVISLDSQALMKYYPETRTQYPASPLVLARLGLLKGQLDDENLTSMMAREAAFQVMRRQIPGSKLRNINLGTVEKDYLAAQEVYKISVDKCQEIYEKFRASGERISGFI